VKLTLIAFSFFYGVVHDLPDVEVLDNYTPPTVTRVYDQDQKEVVRFYRQRRVPIGYNDLPQFVIDAFTSTEDKRFFEHGGVDTTAFSRAMVQNLINLTRNKRLLGASTITQQLAKMLFTGSERSVTRKLREAILAVRIDRQLDKEPTSIKPCKNLSCTKPSIWLPFPKRQLLTVLTNTQTEQKPAASGSWGKWLRTGRSMPCNHYS